MDHNIYAEQIVKREKDSKTALAQGMIIALAVMFLLVLVLLPPLMPTLPAFAVGIAVLVVFLVRRVNVEYEYAITGSKLDVDVIRGKSSRKRMLSVEVRSFDILAPVESAEQIKELKKTAQSVFKAVSGDKAEGCWYAMFSSGDTGRTILVFQPNQRVMDIMLRYVSPLNVKKA